MKPKEQTVINWNRYFESSKIKLRTHHSWSISYNFSNSAFAIFTNINVIYNIQISKKISGLLQDCYIKTSSGSWDLYRDSFLSQKFHRFSFDFSVCLSLLEVQIPYPNKKNKRSLFWVAIYPFVDPHELCVLLNPKAGAPRLNYSNVTNMPNISALP